MGEVTMRSGPARGKIEWDIFNLAIPRTNEPQHDKNVLTRGHEWGIICARKIATKVDNLFFLLLDILTHENNIYTFSLYT